MSSLRFGGVAEILESVRAETVEGMRERLLERKKQGRSDLSDEEIESIARIAGTLAKQTAANGIGQAYQMGVDRNATENDFDRPTMKISEPK